MSSSKNNNKDNFEMQFRNAFEGKTQMPPAHLWQNIEAQIKPTPWYRTAGFYWLSGAVAVLLMLVMFYYTSIYEQQGEQNTNAHTELIITEKNTNNTTKEKTPIIDHANKNNHSNNNKLEDNSLLKAQKQEQNPDKNSDAISIVTETNKAQSNSNSQNNAYTNGEQQSSIILKSDEPTDKAKLQNTGSSNIQQQLDADDTQTQISTTERKSTPVHKIDKVQDTPMSIQKLFDMTLGLDVSDYEIPAPIFNAADVDSQVAKTSDKEADAEATEQTLNKADFKAAFFVGVSASMGSFTPNFAVNTSLPLSPVQVYGAERSQIFDDMTDGGINGQIVGTGIDMGYQFNRRFSIQSGLRIANANFSFTNTDIYQTFQSPTVPVSDDSLVYIGNNSVSVQYQFISVPLAVAYEFGSRKKGRMGGALQLGTSMNFINQTGLQSQNPELRYELGEYRERFMSGFLGLSIHYNLTHNLSIDINGSYHTALGSMMQSEGVDALPESVNAGLGIRYYFKRK
ncbi:MAG: outer membrane beta-barrel protein [Bernardetiaceae bacterium]|nr:outer membrane beta-barrel protein [Bernardetiaceae bacterium]